MNRSDDQLYGELWELWNPQKRAKAIQMAGLNPLLRHTTWQNLDENEKTALVDAMFEIMDK